MNRRTFVTAAATGAVVGTAGCLTGAISGDETGETVLEFPDDQPTDSGDLAYPAYAEPFPDFALYDPLAGTTVDTTEIDDECLVCTAFYAYCPAECVLLLGSLATIQHELIDRGLDDDVRFLAITFDPERDTPEELERNADLMGIDLEAGNWHYLRPESDEEAESIVADDLGIGYERVGGDVEYDFNHITVTSLVNPGGYIERAYTDDSPDIDRVTDDIETVVAEWE